MRPVNPEWHNEDRIETATRKWLSAQGWKVAFRLEAKGADITAVDPKGSHWFFEVKGFPATYKRIDGVAKTRSSVLAQRRIWFIEAIGQILSRIKQPGARYALVFPNNPLDSYFEDSALELPSFLRSKLDLWIFLVDETGEVKVLTPQGQMFQEWNEVLFGDQPPTDVETR